MKKLILALLVLGLFLAACEDGGQAGAGDKELPFVGGTSGLLVSFVDDAPPPEVYDGGGFPFDVELKLVNDGEREIKKEDISIEITGVDPVEFAKTSDDFILTPDEDLEAKTKDPEGNILESNPVYVTVSDLNHEQSVTGNLRYPILASICYKYGTNALSRICVKDNLYESGGACEVAGDKGITNSGAPVQVASLSETIAGQNKIAFIFKIGHKGNGRIFKSATGCNEEDVRGDENKVFVTVTTGLAGLECSQIRDGTLTTGYVTLRDGEATIRCEQPITAAGTFLKTVDITMEYDYQEFISTSLLVIHAD